MALARQVRLEDKLRAVSVIEDDDYLIVKSVNVQALIWVEAMHTSVPSRIKTNSHFRKQSTSSATKYNDLPLTYLIFDMRFVYYIVTVNGIVLNEFPRRHLNPVERRAITRALLGA